MDAQKPVQFNLDSNASPASAQVIFLSTDANGRPSARANSVAESLGQTLQPPNSALQSQGYELSPLSKEQTLVWIVTAGDGVSTAENIASRLMLALDEVRRRALSTRDPVFWMPLFGTGAGQLASMDSLSLIVNSFIRWMDNNPGFSPTVQLVYRADLSEAELGALRAHLDDLAAPQTSAAPAPVQKPKAKGMKQTKDSRETEKPTAPEKGALFSDLDPSDALKSAQEVLRDAGAYSGPIDGVLTQDVILSIEVYLEEEHDVLLENDGPWYTLLHVFPDLPSQMHLAIDDHRKTYEDLQNQAFDEALSNPDTPPEPPTDLTSGYHSDRPVSDLENDTLGRVAIADAIADNILHVWPEHMGPDAPRPMAVHLSGRWGSGKSTILNFLRHKLETDLRFAPPTSGRVKLEHKKGWVIADFNAWRMQDAGEAWWTLCDSLVAAAQDSMGAPIRAKRLYWRDWLWQRWKLNGPQLFVAFVLLAIASIWSFTNTLQNWPPQDADAVTPASQQETTGDSPAPSSTSTARSQTSADGVTTTVTTVIETPKAPQAKPPSRWQFLQPLIALATFLGSIKALLGYTEKFNKTNAEVAEAIRKLQSEPNAELRHRYKRVVSEIGKPVAVFIDDLDRCRADYVVELLQGLQTTFSDVPVLYVVAADRDWIVSSYNQQFEGFQGEISKPGQPLGYLFVKKIFQLSVNVPDLAPYQAQALTEELLKPLDAPQPELPPAAQKRADIKAIEAADSIEDLKEVAKTIGEARRSSTVSREIFAKVREEAAQEEIKHALLQYADLFDANPRAIKRLVNAMTFRTGYVLMAGADLSFDLIARYTILDLRFPYTAAYLAEHPQKVDPKHRDKGSGKTPAADAAYFHDGLIENILTGLTAQDIKDMRPFA